VIGWGYANLKQKLPGLAQQYKQHKQADIRSNVVALALTNRYLSQHLRADLLQMGGTLTMKMTSDERKEMEKLRLIGFTERTIARLYRMRQTYGQDKMDQIALDQRHLEFARWLVQTGRLSDQLSER
jgi:hypothetical protein